MPTATKSATARTRAAALTVRRPAAAVLRERAAVRAATAAKPNDAPAPRRPMSKEQFDRLSAELQRRCDKAAIGDVFPSPFGGYVIKTPPFTEEDVYASY